MPPWPKQQADRDAAAVMGNGPQQQHDETPRGVGAVIVSAGDSSRMRGLDKTVFPLAGVPLIARTVEAFEATPDVDAIVVVISQQNLPAVAEMAKTRGWSKVQAVRLGGARRQDSVRLGLKALPACEWVVVHDGARPLVTEPLIAGGLAAAQPTGAAIAAVPVKDTIKVVSGETVVETPDRGGLWAVQTPQVFKRELLERAHDEILDDVTDDAAMMERLGISVRVFSGDYANIKVTTPEDLLVAEALLAAPERSEASE